MVLSYWRPDDVFAWLLNMIGAVILVVWAFIARLQLRLRRALEREAPERLAVRMWAFPWLTWVALAGMAAILVLMAREPDTRVQLYWTGGMTLFWRSIGPVRQRRRTTA